MPPEALGPTQRMRGSTGSDGALPTSLDSVSIDQAGAYAVTIPAGVTANAASLTLNDAGATLDVRGTLTIADALVIDAGKVIVDVGNDISVGGYRRPTRAPLNWLLQPSCPLVGNGGGTIDVDSGNILTIAGSTITSGTVNDGTSTSGATIAVDGLSAIDGAGVNNGAISITAGATLTLDSTTVTGTTITSLSTLGTTPGTGTVNVDSGKALTLAGTDTISGGLLAFALGPVQAAAGGSVLFSPVQISDLNSGANPSVTLTMQASSGLFAADIGFGRCCYPERRRGDDRRRSDRRQQRAR